MHNGISLDSLINMFLFFEKYGPLVCATIFTTALAFINLPNPSNHETLFSTAATIAAIFSSYTGVILAILMSIKSTEPYKKIIRYNKENLLFGYLIESISTSMALATISLVGLYFSKDDGRMFFVVYPWFFVAIYALLTQIRILRIFFKLLKDA